MKKKFIFWLCRILKVHLVEPIDQVTHVKVVHERVPYMHVKEQLVIDEQDLRHYSAVHEARLTMQHRIMQQIEPFIEWEAVSNAVDQKVYYRAQLYVAKPNPKL